MIIVHAAECAILKVNYSLTKHKSVVIVTQHCDMYHIKFIVYHVLY